VYNKGVGTDQVKEGCLMFKDGFSWRDFALGVVTALGGVVAIKLWLEKKDKEESEVEH
jgi:hypothetical protein